MGLVRSGQVRRARQEQDRLLKSRYGRIAALEALNWKLPSTARKPAEEILRLADGLDLYRPSPDYGFVRLEEKPGGGYRPIASFSFRDKARQRLTRWALEPFAEVHPSQYGREGGTSRP
jgi:hypothetical protein